MHSTPLWLSIGGYNNTPSDRGELNRQDKMVVDSESPFLCKAALGVWTEAVGKLSM